MSRGQLKSPRHYKSNKTVSAEGLVLNLKIRHLNQELPLILGYIMKTRAP